MVTFGFSEKVLKAANFEGVPTFERAVTFEILSCMCMYIIMY